MIQKFAVLFGLVLSASCMVLHQPLFSTIHDSYYDSNPNYNFEARTGDIKSQHESRQGGTVLRQYSLVQPDGVQRTVDYRANDYTGFHATVNNQERQAYGNTANFDNNPAERRPNLASNLRNLGQAATQAYQAHPNAAAPRLSPHPAPAPTVPVAVSTSSFSQTFSQNPISAARNVHNLWR